MLTLRDLQSAKSHAVPPSGVVIGREGGDADITVRTASVSKKHARVFFEDGTWFLEDLRSANGTFVDNEKIAEPMVLKVKTVFDLAGYRFEVSNIVEDKEEEEEPSEEDESGRTFTGTSPEPPPEPKRPGARLGPGGRPPPRAAPADQGKTTAGKPTAKASAAPKPTMEQSAVEEEQEEEAPQDEQEQVDEKPEGEEPEAANSGESEQPEAEEPSEATREQAAVAPAAEEASAAANADDLKDPKAAAGKVMRDLPKAIAYYMVAVPKLLFNPKGTILKSVENQPFPGIDGLPLIAWALPGLATTFAVSLVCGLFAQIIGLVRGGGFSIGALIMSILMVAIGPVVGGIFTAFLFHRITDFFIKLFKGQSDLKSRTNYLIFFMGVTVLMAVPNGATVLFGALTFIPVVGGFLLLIPILLQLASYLIMLGASYVWAKYFKVHPIIPKIILVFMALAALGTIFSSLGAIKLAFSGGTAAVASVPTGGDTKATEDSSGDEDSTGAKPLDSALKKKIDDAKKAAAEAAKAGKEAADDVKEAAEDGAKAAKEAADKAVKEAKEAAKETPKKTPEPEPEPEPKKVAATPTPAPNAEGSSATPPAEPTGDMTPYQRWAAKRAFVEKAIEADPTILSKDAGLMKLYKQFHDKHRDIRKKIGGKTPIAPDDLPALRQVDAEMFTQTGKLMEDLYSRVRK